MASYQFKTFRAFHYQLVLQHWQEPWVSQHDLARRFGITDAWCSQILTSPEALELIKQLGDRTVDTALEVQAQLQAIAPQALQERINIAMSPATPVGVRDRSLQSLLEMAGHRPVQRVQLQRPEASPPPKTEAEIRDELFKAVSAGGEDGRGSGGAPENGPDGKLIN